MMVLDPMARRCCLRGLCAGAVLALAACAADPTPYQPAANGYGFTQQKIEDNRYRVTIAGNTSTNLDPVRHYMLVRAAETTIESGNDYFIVVDQNTESSTSYRGTGSSPFGFGTGYRGGGGVGIGISTFSAYPDDSYTSWADIVVGKGPKPAGDLNAYDARDVLSSIGPSVVRAPGVMSVIPPPQPATDG
jgi:hypothetical protein